MLPRYESTRHIVPVLNFYSQLGPSSALLTLLYHHISAAGLSQEISVCGHERVASSQTLMSSHRV